MVLTCETYAQHGLQRSEDYQKIQAIATKDVDWAVMEDLLISELWDVYKVSRRENPHRLHESVKRAVTRQLRQRGVTLTPDSRPVIKLPASAAGTKREVIAALRQLLRASFIPLCICDFVLTNVRVVRELPSSLGSELANHKSWIAKMNGNTKLPCTCYLYPELPRRHGHVFCPSWSYVGPHQETVCSSNKSKVIPGSSAEATQYAVREAWFKYLPKALLPYGAPIDPERRNKPTQARHLLCREVRDCARALSQLVVVSLDKCNSRNLIL